MANEPGGGGGGGRKRIKDLKPDLESVNNLLSDITTKLGSIQNLDQFFQLKISVSGQEGLDQIQQKMKGVAKINKALAANLGTLATTHHNLQKEMKVVAASIDSNAKAQERNSKAIEKNSEAQMANLASMQKQRKEVEAFDKSAKKLFELQEKQQKLQLKKKDLDKNELAQLKKLTKENDNLEKGQKTLEDEAVKLMEKEEDLTGAGKELEVEGDKDVKSMIKLQKQAEKLDSPFAVLAKTIGGQVLGALDKFADAVISLSIDSVFVGLELIQKGLTKVYDLFERTTKAVGQFNLGIGGTTAGLEDARKSAFEVEGEMRALTGGELGVGLKMWEETSHSLGRVGKGFNDITTAATRAGRGLGIGGAAAGELSATFLAMGDMSIKVGDDMEDAAKRAGMSTTEFSKKLKQETSTALVSVSDAANAAGVSVADFGKEIAGAKGFMATFGKTGEKVFLKAASYFKKLGVSIQSMQKFTDMTDTFESTAQAAAKMNTVFGTSINSMELMLEQDPSKRLEMVRNQFKAQGKDWDSMNRQEKKFFADTMNLTEDEAAAVMTSNMTLDDFQKKQSKAAKQKMSDEDKIRKGMAATAETLFNFGQAWDAVTKSMVKLLAPFLKVLGLLDETTDKKGNKSFAVNMAAAFAKLEKIIGKVSDKLAPVMESLGKDFKSIFDVITGDGPESDKMIDTIVNGITAAAGAAKKLYDIGKKVVETVFTEKNLDFAMKVFTFIADHIEGIVGGFIALKVAMGAASVVSGLVSTISAIGGSGGLIAGIEVLTGTILPALGTAFTTILAPAAALAAALGVGYLIGTAIEKVAENLTIGGKSVQDILLDTAMAWKDNLGLLFTDSWELIKSLIRSQIPGFMEDLIPDFLKKKGTKEIAQEKGMALTGEAGLEGILKKLQESKGGEGLTEKQISSLGTRFADWRDSDIKKVLEEGGIKDISGTLEKMRGKAAVHYDTGYQDPTAAGLKGIDLSKGAHALGWKGNAAPVPGAATPMTPASATSAPAAAQTADQKPVNLATKAQEKKATVAGKEMTLVAGDVYLDGNLVGRHLLRGAGSN